VNLKQHNSKQFKLFFLRMSSHFSTTTEIKSKLSINIKTQTEMINKRKFLDENNIFIPDRYYARIFSMGLIGLLIKLIENVNDEQEILTFLESKRGHDDWDDIEKQLKLKKVGDNDESSKATNKSDIVFIDSNDDEDIRPNTAYSTKSFYGSD
jgi:hypothetical protein